MAAHHHYRVCTRRALSPQIEEHANHTQGFDTHSSFDAQFWERNVCVTQRTIFAGWFEACVQWDTNWLPSRTRARVLVLQGIRTRSGNLKCRFCDKWWKFPSELKKHENTHIGTYTRAHTHSHTLVPKHTRVHIGCIHARGPAHIHIGTYTHTHTHIQYHTHHRAVSRSLTLNTNVALFWIQIHTRARFVQQTRKNFCVSKHGQMMSTLEVRM